MTATPSRAARRGRRARRPPGLSVAVVAVAMVMFLVPLAALAWRAPWSQAGALLTEPAALQALRLSLVVSVAATGLSMVLGLPLAWLLARVEFVGRRWLRALLTLPMVLPPVVGGIALLAAFGRRGLVGEWLDRWFGIRLAFTTSGAVLAAAFVSMPFFIVTVEAALRSVDHRLEEAARTLRASPLGVFRRVTLPLIRPSLAAGTTLCWARALGEFGATITFAGNFPGRTQTVPLAAYLALESNPPAAIVLSLVLLAVSVVVLAALRERWLGAFS